MHCSPAPPWMSSRTLIAEAIAPLSGRPQVTAIRLIAIEGACGPWSTAETKAASSSAPCSGDGMSPLSINQIICGKLMAPMSCSIGYPRNRMTPGFMSMIAVDHHWVARWIRSAGLVSVMSNLAVDALCRLGEGGRRRELRTPASPMCSSSRPAPSVQAIWGLRHGRASGPRDSPALAQCRDLA